MLFYCSDCFKVQGHLVPRLNLKNVCDFFFKIYFEKKNQQTTNYPAYKELSSWSQLVRIQRG